MLALLCKTAGGDPPPPDALQLRRDAAEREWEHLAHAFKRELVFTVLKTIRLACPHAFAIFEKGGAEAAQALPRYRELVPEPPDDYQALRHDRVISSFPSRSAFDEACRAVPRAGIAYWSSDVAASTHPGGRSAAAGLAVAAHQLADAVEVALDANRPHADAPPPPLWRNASHCAEAAAATLEEQIGWHVEKGGLEGEVLFDPHALSSGSTGLSSAATAAGRAHTLREIWSAEELARCAVLVTSSERLSLEQRHATASVKLPARAAIKGGGSQGSGSLCGEPSVLCEVQWVRLVCDEGHSLGGGALTNAKVLLDSIPAERRWVLSGTPAKESSDSDGVAMLGAPRLPARSAPQGSGRPLTPLCEGGGGGNHRRRRCWGCGRRLLLGLLLRLPTRL